jgi:hypothetical protein
MKKFRGHPSIMADKMAGMIVQKRRREEKVGRVTT